jgi:hypothetical protein
VFSSTQAYVGAELGQNGDIVDLVACDSTIPNDMRALLAGGADMMAKVKASVPATEHHDRKSWPPLERWKPRRS